MYCLFDSGTPLPFCELNSGSNTTVFDWLYVEGNLLYDISLSPIAK
jgi:hypothetical protein